MRAMIFLFCLMSFGLFGSSALAATVSSPCDLDALKRVLPEGPDFDGTIHFACDQNDEIIEIDQAFVVNQNLAIDGNNASGSGNQIVFRAADQPQCTIQTDHRLFLFETDVSASIQDLHIQWFRADDGDDTIVSDADNGGAIYNRGNLVLDNVTLSGNVASGMGGAIFSKGDLTIRNSQIGIWDPTDHTNCEVLPGVTPPNPYGPNTANTGAAIAITDSLNNDSETLISGAVFNYNTANEGGTIWAQSIHGHTAKVKLFESALLNGNGAFYASGLLTFIDVENTSIEGHHSSKHVITNLGANVTLRDSTIVRNSSTRGAIATSVWQAPNSEHVSGGNTVIINSTISANSTYHNGADDFGTAGVISYDSTQAANPKPSVTLVNSTVARNKSFQYHRDESEGNALVRGINVSADAGLVTLVNTIVAEPLILDYDGVRIAEPIVGDANCGSAGQRFSLAPEILAEGVNLDSDGSCIEFVGLGQAFVNGAPTPAGLADDDADNGGSTNTIALLSGSAAIDAADNDVCRDSDSVNNRDQRNAPRTFEGTFGDSCDIGAFEYESTPGATPLLTPTPSPAPQATPSPTPSASPTTTPMPTASPESSSSPTANPTPTPEPSPSPTASATTMPSFSPPPTSTPQVSATPSPTGAGGDNGSGSLDLLLCLLGLSLGLRRLQIAVGFIRGNLLCATRRST